MILQFLKTKCQDGQVGIWRMQTIVNNQIYKVRDIFAKRFKAGQIGLIDKICLNAILLKQDSFV